MSKNYSDGELLLIVKSKVQEERNLTLEVIELLREIQNRKLHLKRGYSSLFEFCVQELKYSNGAAYRRIKAMKLVEEIPEAAESIQSGCMNLTTASQLQAVFETKAKESEPLTVEQKTQLFTQVQNQSKREVEQTLAQVCPEFNVTPEKTKVLCDDKIKLELVIDRELYEQIQKLKALTSHKNKSLTDCLKQAVEAELKRCDPEQKKLRSTVGGKDIKSRQGISRSKVSSPENSNLPTNDGISLKIKRYIPSTVRHQVWLRDRGRCTFVDPLTRRSCGSSYKITYEHIQPFGMGGDHLPDNLRLLCANHNALTAVNAYGHNKMKGYSKNKS